MIIVTIETFCALRLFIIICVSDDVFKGLFELDSGLLVLFSITAAVPSDEVDVKLALQCGHCFAVELTVLPQDLHGIKAI